MATYRNHYLHCGYEWVSLSQSQSNMENCHLCGHMTPPFMSDDAPPKHEWDDHNYLITDNVEAMNNRSPVFFD